MSGRINVFYVSVKPGSHMPPNYLRHSRRYCLGYCSDIEFNFAGTSAVLLERRRKETFYVNEAGDRRRCTSGKYSPQFIMSKMEDVLAQFFKFTGGASQVHLRHHCTAPGTKNHVNRRQQRRSSQVGQWHMRTRLYSLSNRNVLYVKTISSTVQKTRF